MAKDITLKLNGKPFNPLLASTNVSRIIEFLDASPKDELFTSDQVSEKVGLPRTYFKDNGKVPALADYCHRVNTSRYWGNPIAIRELRKRMGGK